MDVGDNERSLVQTIAVAGGAFAGYAAGYFFLLDPWGRLVHEMFWRAVAAGNLDAEAVISSPVFWKLALPALVGGLVGASVPIGAAGRATAPLPTDSAFIAAALIFAGTIIVVAVGWAAMERHLRTARASDVPIDGAPPSAPPPEPNLVFEPGVGIRGTLELCATSENVLAALGQPEKVTEISNYWDGLVDDYEYAEGLAVRVQKKQDRVIEISATTRWMTVDGIRPGATEFDLKRHFGSCSPEPGYLFNEGVTCSSKGAPITFVLGDRVRALDDRGLPRDVRSVTSVVVRKTSCAAPRRRRPARKGAGETCVRNSDCTSEECAFGYCD